MGTYPQPVRDAAIQCVPCNAPAVLTVGGDYVCVECGARPVTSSAGDRRGDRAIEPGTAND